MVAETNSVMSSRILLRSADDFGCEGECHFLVSVFSPLLEDFRSQEGSGTLG